MISQNPFDETKVYGDRNDDDRHDDGLTGDQLGGSEDSDFENSELISLYDRYASALDSGDEKAAEAILEEYPGIGEEFREPLRGLYLLGQNAKHQKLEDQLGGQEGRRQLGDFEIENELGRGGMGIVYAATQISLQRRVALKILPFTAVLDPKQVARFRNEAQAAASLHHPNIVPVFGVGCERGVHYYSMQLIEGQSLEQFINQLKLNHANRDPLEPSRPFDFQAETEGNLSTVVSHQSPNYIKNVVQLGAHVAEALDFAHEQGVVHRDIKPSNLMLDQSGKIWVTDFGLARCRGNSNLTSQGDRLGTARYMSPEQAAGRMNQVDFRADIYSLGVTLYEMLALRPAFDAPNRIQLMAAIESDTPVRLRKINSGISVDLDTVIEKSISREPSERYESARAFADDLNRCLRGEPIQAKRRGLLERCLKLTVKHKKKAAVAALFLTLTAVIASVLASTFYQQRLRENAAADKARFYLRQAHQVVDRFSGHVFDEISSVPGTESLQAELMTEAIGYYDCFLKFAEDAPGLRFEQATAYARLAQLKEKTGFVQIAEQQYKRAISILGGLDLDSEVLFEKAVCLNRLALLQFNSGRNDECLSHLKKSLSCFDELQAWPPCPVHDVEVAAAHAQTVANAGTIHWALGKNEEAYDYFEDSLADLKSKKSVLTNAVLRSAYFKINGSFTRMLIESDPDRAAELLRVSISGLKKSDHDLGESDLVDENQEHIADMENNLAIVMLQKGDLKQAERLSTKAVEFWKSKASVVPENLVFTERLATAINTLGEIEFRKRSDGFGDASFKEAELLFQRIIQVAPSRPEPISRLAGVFHNRSLAASQGDLMDNAFELISKAIRYQKQAVELAPQNARYRHLLNAHENARSAFLTSTSSTAPAQGDEQ